MTQTHFPTTRFFDLPPEVAYLNSAFTSPLLRASKQAAEQATVLKSHPWQLAPSEFLEGPERVRELTGKLLETSSDTIALVPSVSYAMATAANILPVRPERTIIFVRDEFPSTVYAWQARARDTGEVCKFVDRPEGSSWTEALLNAIDAQTGILSLCHSHWMDGRCCDLERIAARAREVGAYLVVDGTQSIGALPFVLNRMEPDVVVTAPHKWLFGPYGIALMYVAPEWHDTKPIENNWMNRVNSENFRSLTDYQSCYRAGARRFDVGECSSFFLLPMLEEALKTVLAWGVDSVARYTRPLVDLCAQQMGALGFTPVPSSERSPHMLGLRAPVALGEEYLAALRREQVYVSVRGESVRVSVHAFNDEGDVWKLVDLTRVVLR